MVISDEYHYLFVELPFTASTAISKELREHYGGRSILGKHSTYREFLRFASPEQSKYYVFSGVRNPLGEVVSLYVKYQTNPGNIYTDPEWWVTRRMIRRFRWVQAKKASFPEFFERFYWLPYENWSSLDHHRFNYVYRLEQVVAEFPLILKQIGIEPRRELPLVHKTRGKANWREAYTANTYKRARWVFGPFMSDWGYTFPEDWCRGTMVGSSRSVYRLRTLVKNRLRLLRGRRSHYPRGRLP